MSRVAAFPLFPRPGPVLSHASTAAAPAGGPSQDTSLAPASGCPVLCLQAGEPLSKAAAFAWSLPAPGALVSGSLRLPRGSGVVSTQARASGRAGAGVRAGCGCSREGFSGRPC